MSIQVLERTKDSIGEAFKQNDPVLLEKEIQFLLYAFSDFISDEFAESVRFISFRKMTIKSTDKLLAEANVEAFYEIIELLEQQKVHGLEFKSSKFSFDKLFAEVTEDGYIDYDYELNELLSVEEASKYLGVSRPTIYKYLTKGLEFKELNNVKRIPKVALDLWKDSSIAFELQWIYQQNQKRWQTTEDKIAAVQKKITELEMEFGGEFKLLYGHLNDHELDQLDEATDLYDWKQYLNEKAALIKQLRIERGQHA
ncbi:helix-turn-helix domain-containing protein [Chryseomicrobium sp. FSL W7-1435]|uniref:helix-turn-helix domain-containing protein n=1 Tax=Chryseomicrobium sp. FSL W7-1435 TaxID=2921704 RepID=UPI00315AAB3A